MNDRTITVDVRDDIRSGREPFSKIMKAAAALRPDEQLLLIAPFEPVPLFLVMEKQGFGHTGHATASGDWEILFTRDCIGAPNSVLGESPKATSNQLQSPATNEQRAQVGVGRSDTVHAKGDLSLVTSLRLTSARQASAATKIHDVDARGLEPPQPLVKILETLAALPAGAELRACTDRRPMHLYPQLEERGFAALTEEQPDGSFLTHIRPR